MVVPGTMFEEFGFNYVGPIDGHDLESLIPTLHNLRELRGPQFLHIVTRKGQGYKLAEADPMLYHGPGKFDPARASKSPPRRPSPRSRRCFRRLDLRHGRAGQPAVAVTPAMREGSGLVEFEKRFPRPLFTMSASPSSMRSPSPPAWPARA
jgi:1-deoxy-D-xylulose-5-phosphate synthase